MPTSTLQLKTSSTPFFTRLLQSATFYKYYRILICLPPPPAYLVSDRLRIPDGAPAKLKFFCANFESYANLAR